MSLISNCCSCWRVWQQQMSHMSDEDTHFVPHNKPADSQHTTECVCVNTVKDTEPRTFAVLRTQPVHKNFRKWINKVSVITLFLIYNMKNVIFNMTTLHLRSETELL